MSRRGIAIGPDGSSDESVTRAGSAERDIRALRLIVTGQRGQDDVPAPLANIGRMSGEEEPTDMSGAGTLRPIPVST